jgi:hypothetical protein
MSKFYCKCRKYILYSKWSRPVSDEKMRDQCTIKGRNHILIGNDENLEFFYLFKNI